MAKDLNRQLCKADKQIINKHTKRFSISSSIREIQIRPQRYHFTTTRTATIRKTDNSKSWC